MIKQYKLFDDDGNIVTEVETKGSVLKEGWIVMYKESLAALVREAPSMSVLKVFLELSSMQSFGVYVMTSKSNLAKRLQISRKTAWSALRWLSEHSYIHEDTLEGQTAFIINPSVSTCGSKNLVEKKKVWENRKTDVYLLADHRVSDEENQKNEKPLTKKKSRSRKLN